MPLLYPSGIIFLGSSTSFTVEQNNPENAAYKDTEIVLIAYDGDYMDNITFYALSTSNSEIKQSSQVTWKRCSNVYRER